jgi:hypothetical protein
MKIARKDRVKDRKVIIICTKNYTFGDMRPYHPSLPEESPTNVSHVRI